MCWWPYVADAQPGTDFPWWPCPGAPGGDPLPHCTKVFRAGGCTNTRGHRARPLARELSRCCVRGPRPRWLCKSNVGNFDPCQLLIMRSVCLFLWLSQRHKHSAEAHQRCNAEPAIENYPVLQPHQCRAGRCSRTTPPDRQRADAKIVAARRKYFAAGVSVGALGIAPRELAGPAPWPSGRA